MASETSAIGGLMAITVAVVAVSVLITLVTGQHRHWVPAICGIIIGWMAVGSIGR